MLLYIMGGPKADSSYPKGLAARDATFIVTQMETACLLLGVLVGVHRLGIKVRTRRFPSQINVKRRNAIDSQDHSVVNLMVQWNEFISSCVALENLKSPNWAEMLLTSATQPCLMCIEPYY